MNKEDVVQALMNAACNCITDSELRDNFEQIIFENHFDHPKVKLPREVGEELDAWKRKWGIDVGEYLTSVCTSDSDTPKAQEWHEAGYGRERSNQLADAYRYGWEAEPEAKWYVKAPESWKADGCGLDWFYKQSRGGVDMCSHTGESDEQFTSAELKLYHLDSDIFTLVPVENEEVSQ